MSIVMITTMKCILIDDSDEDSINLAPNADAEDEEGGWQTRKMFTKTKYWKRMKKL